MDNQIIENIISSLSIEQIQHSLKEVLHTIPNEQKINLNTNNMDITINFNRAQCTSIQKPELICPCCGWNGNSFLTYNNRLNALCPACHSAERHRHYYLYLLRNIPIDREIKVLHFAPEASITKIFTLYNNVQYITCDIQEGKAQRVEDMTNISFEDNSFYIIFASHILEHIEDDIKAMKEIHRVLKSEGFSILQVPLFTEHEGKALTTSYEDLSINTPEERAKVYG